MVAVNKLMHNEFAACGRMRQITAHRKSGNGDFIECYDCCKRIDRTSSQCAEFAQCRISFFISTRVRITHEWNTAAACPSDTFNSVESSDIIVRRALWNTIRFVDISINKWFNAFFLAIIHIHCGRFTSLVGCSMHAYTRWYAQCVGHLHSLSEQRLEYLLILIVLIERNRLNLNMSK